MRCWPGAAPRQRASSAGRPGACRRPLLRTGRSSSSRWLQQPLAATQRASSWQSVRDAHVCWRVMCEELQREEFAAACALPARGACVCLLAGSCAACAGCAVCRHWRDTDWLGAGGQGRRGRVGGCADMTGVQRMCLESAIGACVAALMRGRWCACLLCRLACYGAAGCVCWCAWMPCLGPTPGQRLLCVVPAVACSCVGCSLAVSAVCVRSCAALPALRLA